MTNSGSPLPPVPPVQPAQVLPRGDSKATILSLPAQLQNLPRTARVEGQVIQINQDGSVVIRTGQGDVAAKVWAPQPPAQGQQVQIDLQAGNPPRQAVVRAAPDNNTQPQQTSQGSSAPPPSGGTTQSPPNGGATQTPSQTGTTQTTPPPQGSSSAPPQGSQPAVQNPAAPPPSTSGTSPRIDVTTLPPLPEGNALPGQAQPLQPNQPVRLLLLTPQTQVLPFPPPALLKGALFTQPSPLTEGQSLLTEATPGTIPLTGKTGGDLFITGRGSPFETPLSGTSEKPASPASGFIGRLGGKLSEFLSGGLQKTDPTSPSLLTGRPVTLAQAIAGKATQFDALIKAVLPPGSPPLPETQSVPGQITATVIGFTKQGLPVLSVPSNGTLPAQEFVLQFPAAGLETGVKIALSPQITGAFIQETAPSGLAPLSLDPALSEWPALQSMSQISPQAAQILSQILPNPGAPAQLPAAAILFLAAVQGGNLSSWMGDKTIDLLRRAGKADLIGRLTGDMETAKNASSQTVAQDWKAVPLPLYYDGQIDKAMLWFRHDGENAKDDDKKNKQTRFVMDLNLNRMGAVQLDGLAKQQRIDLIVRTTRPVSDNMRQYMRQRYLHALDRAEYTGELSFQDRADQFVKVDARGHSRPFSA